MLTTDTIIACATGPGRSRRAMLRVFGPDAHSLGNRICSEYPTQPGTIARATLTIGPGLELPCLVLRYDRPRTFTGQDGFELVIPGNPALVERVIKRILSEPGVSPVREAGPGEYSARAYLNGKMTLQEAEGIAAIIAAQTQEQLAAANEVASGRAGRKYQAWADELTNLLALVEAGIDFTDQEDVVPIAPRELDRRLKALVNEIRGEVGAAAGAERSSDSRTVVLAGAPNAGKSTLFNALLCRRRAVESPVPGTTRDAIVEDLDLARETSGAESLSVRLTDLAGLDDRTSLSGTDAAAQDVAQEHLQQADVVIWCDPAGRFTGQPPGRAGATVIRVRTKADLPSPSRNDDGAIGVCALDGWHLGALRRAITDAAWSAERSERGSPTVLVARHRRTLSAAVDRLASADRSLSVQLGSRAINHVELIADELRTALDLLGELVGRIAPDEVIGRVFATFCVGK